MGVFETALRNSGKVMKAGILPKEIGIKMRSLPGGPTQFHHYCFQKCTRGAGHRVGACVYIGLCQELGVLVHQLWGS